MVVRVALAGLLAWVAGRGVAREHVLPNVPLIAQEQGYWCWAACGETVLEALGTPVAQCELANFRFTLKDCPCDSCTSGTRGCNHTGWPDFERWGWACRRTTCEPLSWRDLQRALRTQPVAFTHRDCGSGGHMYVAYGHAEGRGLRLLHVRNPKGRTGACQGRTQVMSYDAYVSGPHWRHWHDFHSFSILETQPPRAPAVHETCPGPCDRRAVAPLATGPRDAALALAKARDLVRLLSEASLRELGFDPPVSPGSLRLDAPLRGRRIGLDDLRDAAGLPPSRIIADAGLVSHPIWQDDRLVALLTLMQDGDGWTLASLTSRPEAEAVVALRHRLATVPVARTPRAQERGCPIAPPPAAAEDIYEVDVPALGRTFLAYDAAGEAWLTPLEDFAQAREGTCDAATVLRELAAAAADVGPDPN